MPRIDCSISVNFVATDRSNFTYFSISQPPPWQISTDGNIRPSSRSRMIAFMLDCEPVTGTFAGIKLSKTPDGLQNEDPYFNNTNLQVRRIPEDDPTTFVVDDNCREESEKVWFAIGVRIDDRVYWDDPKIYNPPDD